MITLSTRTLLKYHILNMPEKFVGLLFSEKSIGDLLNYCCTLSFVEGGVNIQQGVPCQLSQSLRKTSH